MIDIHNHILWGLDDGARTIRDSLEMCSIAYNDGIRTIVATPHTLNGLYRNERDAILERVEELNVAIEKGGGKGSESGVDPKERVPGDPLTQRINPPQINQTDGTNGIDRTDRIDRTDQIDLQILPGADVHLSEEILRQLDGKKVTTLGDGGKYLLLEFPFNGIPYGAEGVLFQLISRGIIPIISHPERNFEVGQNPRRYDEMIRMGCLGQVTAMSLTGGFGSGVMRIAEKLLRNGLVHVIASDAHSTDGRPPTLSDAVCAAARIVGQEQAWRMVTEYPRALLEGRRPDLPDG